MLREALKLQPGHADLLGDLAVLHLQAGRHSQCIQAAREAQVADPTHDESAYALGMVGTTGFGAGLGAPGHRPAPTPKPVEIPSLGASRTPPA